MSKRDGIMEATPLLGQQWFWGKPYIVQPKLRGNRLRVVVSQDGSAIFRSGGGLCLSLAHISNDLLPVCQDLSGHLELDGEAYLHGMTEAEIGGIVRRKAYDPSHDKIEFHVFDIITNDIQSDRLALLQAFFSTYSFRHIRLVPHFWCSTDDEMKRHLDGYIGQGYEGIILRHPDALYQRKRVNTLLKLKPRNVDIYPVIGCTEERSVDGVLKGSLGAFVCKKGDHVFNVGTGPVLTKDARRWLWDMKALLDAGFYHLEVQYQDPVTARGIPCQPVALRLIKNALIGAESEG